MKKLLIGLVTGIFLFTLVGMASAIPVLQNGSLTGPINNGGVPTGWNISSGSPDTMDQNHNVGGSFGGFQATPSPSPDGGTWVGLGRDGAFIESFGQTINGFDIGTSYDLAWYHGNFGFDLGYNGANAIEVLLDGISLGSGSLLALSTNWIDEMISFVATAATHRIDFRLQYGTKAYHSIDGISLSETAEAPVPEPSTLILLGCGLLGLGWYGRKRRKA